MVYKTRSIRSTVDIVGPEKILFGSDFPLLIYPHRYREKDFQTFITNIKENANLNEEEWSKVMRINAEKILNLRYN
ncbi:MAG: amidohydrolase family protein [Tissierella sp.]|uniref:amidohydrolase family protein n=1 Tax=Tissierella sp. TaxID=41274 RepID=UPI003F9D304E